MSAINWLEGSDFQNDYGAAAQGNQAYGTTPAGECVNLPAPQASDKLKCTPSSNQAGVEKQCYSFEPQFKCTAFTFTGWNKSKINCPGATTSSY